jgi:hypothetical protein
VDPELFFDEGHDLGAPTGRTVSPAAKQRRAQAKAICAQCPVLMECREHYLDEVHGVYGGLDRDERHELRVAQRVLLRGEEDGERVGREAFDLWLAGEPLVDLAKRYGMRTRQLRIHLDNYLRTPAGQRAQLEHLIQKAYDEGLTEEDTAFKLDIPLVKVTYLRRKMGLVKRVVSQQPARLSEDRWDSSVNVMGTTLQANYLGESADEPPFYFMQVKYPNASTRKWMRGEDVLLGRGVRRHVISKGVGSGKKRAKDSASDRQRSA